MNLILRTSSMIHRVKEEIIDASIPKTIVFAFVIVVLELLLLVISLPLYIFITPDKFNGDKKGVEKYRLKRKASLTGLLSFALLWLTIFGGVFLVNSAKNVSALSIGWSFDDPTEYIYDSSQIQVIDGMAIFAASVKKMDETPTESTPPAEESQLAPEPAPEPSLEPALEPTPTTEPTPEPTPEPEVTPEVEPVPAPELTPESTPASETYRGYDPIGIAQVSPQPTACRATIQPVNSLTVMDLSEWAGFIEVASKGAGEVYYQLSDDDGLTWYYWDGGWVVAAEGQYSTAAVVDNHIKKFPIDSGRILFRAYLTSDCQSDVKLIDVTVASNQKIKTAKKVSSIAVASPNGGESLAMESTVTIQWVSSNISGNVKIEYSKDDFVSDLHTVADSTPNVGSYDWVVPSDASETIKIKVTSIKSALVADTSDANFAIVSLVKVDPISQWPLDDNSGCTAIDMADNNNGVLGPKCSASAPTWTTGRSGSALLFDGKKDTLTVADANNLDLTKQGSLLVWFKINTYSDYATLIHKGSDVSLSDEAYFLQFGGPDYGNSFRLVAGGHNGSSVSRVVSDTDLDARVWYQAVYTWDISGQRLYLNGRLDASNIEVISMRTSAGSLQIGSRTPNKDYFAGTIDEVGIWNRALSASEIGELYLGGNNTAPGLALGDDAKQFDDGYAYINYTISDTESNFVDLSSYEYSLTGSFAGEEAALTEVTGSTKHDGVSALTSSPTGVSHTFVWNVAADLPDKVNQVVYVRLRPTDGIAPGDFVEGRVLISDTEKPTITNLLAKQAADSAKVKISYNLSDSSSALKVELDISDDGGSTWVVTDTSVTGDIGMELTPGSGKTIIWDAGIDFAGKDESDMRVRLRSTDAYQNINDYVDSADFVFDNQAPIGLNSLKGIEAMTSAIVWAWTPVSDESNFDHYEIWYGKSLVDVKAASGMAAKWDPSNDRGLTSMGAASSSITGLAQATLYYAKIWAVDSFGNRSTAEAAQLTTASTPAAPVVSGSSRSRRSGGEIADTTAPFKPILDQPQTPISQIEVNFSGTAEVGSLVDLYVDGQSTGLRVKAAQNNGAFIGTITLGAGSHTLSVTATDASGNVSEKSDPKTVTIDLTVKPEAPIVPEEKLVEIVPPTTSEIPLVSPELPTTTPVLAEVAGATESPILSAPQVAKVTGVSLGNNITIVGTGIPNSEVVAFIWSERAIAYRTSVDNEGNWSVTHSQNDVELADGDHEVYALTLDANSQIKSQSSEVKKFSIKKNQLALVLSYFDFTTTLLTVLLALIGVAVLLLRQKTVAAEDTKSAKSIKNIQGRK